MDRLISEYSFSSTKDDVSLITLRSDKLIVQLTNYGARLVACWVKLKDGRWLDVVCGYSSYERYLNGKEAYHGATVGPFANRIEHAEFSLDGKVYNLEQNEGPNSLHSGQSGWHGKLWNVVASEENSVTYEYIAKAGEGGFPGNVCCQVTYSIKDSGLTIGYLAQTDSPTVINLTNHAYWNLNGEGSGDVLGHELVLAADDFVAIDEQGIPLRLLPVEGTAFDFRKRKKLGQDIDNQENQLSNGGGYDHCYRLTNPSMLVPFGDVKGDRSGIIMKAYTSEPGVQLYTANHFNGQDVGKSEIGYVHRGAFCLETQHFPDSPNQSNFPSTKLMPDAHLRSMTKFEFLS